ncbi:TauD/TfdA dioxygenase family protein [Luteipulveratus flavus]|uniref:TauD/TfdA family dioxygenase n=1 Tax=Luteipulveratus flavus TaxID=3031728 RepID=A0ABT6CAF5_9MICO|nr:TauD/TfdA family dioxygenase [Luteipulveratus sp. YIM 133296]MDF8265029.1 TauD/TfdA family dioxygenase [Luteipulveratus sp. YIM 133296]
MTTIATDRTVRRLTAHIGAEISGIDITRALSGSDVELITRALHDHKALVFRNAPLDDAGQQQFASHFGTLTTAHPTVPAVEGAPHVLPVDSEGGMPANTWHTDVTFVLNPPKASTLVSHVVAPYGGETLIADTAAAYRNLPEPLRRLADTLWAVHTNDHDYAVVPEDLDDQARLRREIFTSTVFETLHPVVRVHPETGEKGLFLGGFATRLKGLSTSESRDIIRLLQAYVTRPENVVRVTWEPDQLVLFDNRITQHYAPDNYDRTPRRLHRVTVAGDVPVSVSGERSTSLTGDASHYTAS